MRQSSEALAKAWLLRVVERTPLADVGGVEIDLLTREAAPLIASILDRVAAPVTESSTDLPDEARDRARGLGRLRHGDRAASEIPRDLAMLQSLLIESLRRDIPERAGGDFARSVQRLAEIFGSVQGAVVEGLVRERAGNPQRDELTGLPGHPELHEWMQILLAEHHRYGHPFAITLVDIDGLARINDAYGRQGGDRMLVAVATVIRNQVRAVDRPFRIGGDEFGVLSPHEEATGVRPMAERLVNVIHDSQSDEGPRIAITVGISSCPSHGDNAERLVAAAEEATYAAKAANDPVAVATSDGQVPVQDR